MGRPPECQGEGGVHVIGEDLTCVFCGEHTDEIPDVDEQVLTSGESAGEPNGVEPAPIEQLPEGQAAMVDSELAIVMGEGEVPDQGLAIKDGILWAHGFYQGKVLRIHHEPQLGQVTVIFTSRPIPRRRVPCGGRG
jgi:hypothetical protein